MNLARYELSARKVTNMSGGDFGYKVEVARTGVIVCDQGNSVNLGDWNEEGFNYVVFGTVTNPENTVWVIGKGGTGATLANGGAVGILYTHPRSIKEVHLNYTGASPLNGNYRLFYLPIGRAGLSFSDWVELSITPGNTGSGVIHVLSSAQVCHGLLCQRDDALGGSGSVLRKCVGRTDVISIGEWNEFEYFKDVGVTSLNRGDHWLPQSGYNPGNKNGSSIKNTSDDVAKSFTQARWDLGKIVRVEEIRLFSSQLFKSIWTVQVSINNVDWYTLTMNPVAAPQQVSTVTPDPTGETASAANGKVIFDDTFVLVPIPGPMPHILSRFTISMGREGSGTRTPKVYVVRRMNKSPSILNRLGLLDSVAFGSTTYADLVYNSGDAEDKRVSGLQPTDLLAITIRNGGVVAAMQNPTQGTFSGVGTNNWNNSNLASGSGVNDPLSGFGIFDFTLEGYRYLRGSLPAVGSGLGDEKQCRYVRVTKASTTDQATFFGISIESEDEDGLPDLIDFLDDTDTLITEPFVLSVSSFGPFPAAGKEVKVKNKGAVTKTELKAQIRPDTTRASWFTEITDNPIGTWVAHCQNNDIANGDCLVNNWNYRRSSDLLLGVYGCGLWCDVTNGEDPENPGVGLDGENAPTGGFTAGVVTVSGSTAQNNTASYYMRSHVPSGQFFPDGAPILKRDGGKGKVRAAFVSSTLD